MRFPSSCFAIYHWITKIIIMLNFSTPNTFSSTVLQYNEWITDDVTETDYNHPFTLITMSLHINCINYKHVRNSSYNMPSYYFIDKHHHITITSEIRVTTAREYNELQFTQFRFTLNPWRNDYAFSCSLAFSNFLSYPLFPTFSSQAKKYAARMFNAAAIFRKLSKMTRPLFLTSAKHIITPVAEPTCFILNQIMRQMRKKTFGDLCRPKDAFICSALLATLSSYLSLIISCDRKTALIIHIVHNEISIWPSFIWMRWAAEVTDDAFTIPICIRQSNGKQRLLNTNWLRL